MTSSLGYLRPDSAQTLREGLAEYRTQSRSLVDAEALDSEAAALFRQHDAAHVVFGCDLSLRGETLIDTWTIFASSLGWRGYTAYLRLPQVNQIFADAGYVRIAATLLRCAPDVARVVWRSRRMPRKWPWREHERFLDRRLCDIRREFAIAVV